MAWKEMKITSSYREVRVRDREGSNIESQLLYVSLLQRNSVLTL